MTIDEAAEARMITLTEAGRILHLAAGYVALLGPAGLLDGMTMHEGELKVPYDSVQKLKLSGFKPVSIAELERLCSARDPNWPLQSGAPIVVSDTVTNEQGWFAKIWSRLRRTS